MNSLIRPFYCLKYCVSIQIKNILPRFNWLKQELKSVFDGVTLRARQLSRQEYLFTASLEIMSRREWLFFISLISWRAPAWVICVDDGAHKLHFSYGGLDFLTACTSCRRMSKWRVSKKSVFARDPLRYRSSQKTFCRLCMSGFDVVCVFCYSVHSFFPTFPWLCPYHHLLVWIPCNHHLCLGFQ